MAQPAIQANPPFWATHWLLLFQIASVRLQRKAA